MSAIAGFVLVDTRVWIEYFHRATPAGDQLEKLIKDRRVAISGVVLAELLQGAVTEAERDTLRSALQGPRYLEITRDTWQLAGELGFGLRRKGITLPLSDLLLAALALQNELELFTLDKHFQRIAGLALHKT